MSARNRIALYGGTFDPVHLGHLAIARRVCELFEIDQVLFVPAQVAPHKIGRDVTPAIHRYAMLSLATQHDERLLVSTFELESSHPGYTVDTLDHFRNLLPQSQLFFIMGADSWAEISTWRDWQRLLTMANHIVVTRPGYELGLPNQELRDRLIDVRSKYGQEQQTAGVVEHLVEGGPGKIFLTDAVMKHLSATEVRLVASKGEYEQLAKLVPEPVSEYIGKYGIYRKSNEAKLNR